MNFILRYFCLVGETLLVRLSVQNWRFGIPCVQILVIKDRVLSSLNCWIYYSNKTHQVSRFKMKKKTSYTSLNQLFDKSSNLSCFFTLILFSFARILNNSYFVKSSLWLKCSYIVEPENRWNVVCDCNMIHRIFTFDHLLQ